MPNLIILTHLADKSDRNLLCADILHKEGHFASSVHCAYYSLFQRLKLTVVESLGITFKEYDRKENLFVGGSHDFLISTFCKEYLKQKNRTFRDKERIENEIRDLKTKRIKADYKDEEIIEGESLKAFTKSTTLQLHIKNTFITTTT